MYNLRMVSSENNSMADAYIKAIEYMIQIKFSSPI